MRRILSILITLYVSVPVLLYVFPWILNYAVFAHIARFPLFVDLSRPEEILNYTRNFYLNPEEGVSVGVWHTLPASQWKEAVGKSPEWHQETLGDDRPVIIYLHGNLGTRAKSNRVHLAKILSAAGYHVLSLDYRGFGDSTGEPSEAGVTTDALHLYNWVKKQSRGSPVCLWGHSLGTGVATNTAVKIEEEGLAVNALILEAPYTNMAEAIVEHPRLQLYMFLPGFKNLLWNALKSINVAFNNDKNLQALTSPLLILHAEDDKIVPYRMAQQLHQISLQAHKKFNTNAEVKMISYKADLGYAHSGIHLDPNLTDDIGKFLQNTRQQ